MTTKKTITTIYGTLTHSQVVDALIRLLPDDARYQGEVIFTVSVPGGGDWSNTDLEDFEVNWSVNLSYTEEL